MVAKKTDSVDDPSLLHEEDGAQDDNAEVIEAGAIDEQSQVEEQTEGDLEVVIEEGADAVDPVEKADDKGALGATEPDEKTKYSHNMRERIAREQRIAREATARADAAHQGRLVAEAKSRKERREALEITEAALEMQLTGTRAALVAAKEKGESEAEVKYQEALGNLGARKRDIASAKESLTNEEEEAKRGSSATSAPNPLAQQWMTRNPWYGNARFAEQTQITRIIDQELSSKGWDKKSPEYFDELERRVRRRLPEVQKHIRARPGAQPAARRDPPRDPTAGVRRSDAGAGAPRKGNKVTLNRADLTNMVNFGLNPKDPEHQKEYALNKMSGVR